MSSTLSERPLGLVLSLLLASGAAARALPPAPESSALHAGMLRYPDVSATHIAFVYANDIWIVPRGGGDASPLASPPGQEMFPRFSSDGSSLLFQGNYDGNRDLYTIPVAGGSAQRLTHHPAPETPCDWTPDGRILYFAPGAVTIPRHSQLFTIAPTGGLPTKLVVPYGAFGSVSPDAQWLAYIPHTIDFRTWKRYRGGMQTDIWLLNLTSLESRRVTDWEGTDSFPMWHGATLYYLSDEGPQHRQNIWSFDPASGARTQVTEFADYDVKFPSIGPGPSGAGEIVFQNGSGLFLLDLATRQASPVNVTIPGDRPKVRPRTVNAADNIEGGSISATGKRAVVEARGDIWTIPAEKGPVRQITDTSGVAERSPAWSPDGRWIAYFSDASGEYELWVTQSDGKDAPRQLTKGNKTFFFSSTWSPDSKKILLTDKAGNIILVDAETGEQRTIDTDEWANEPQVSWSKDSRWITYAKADPASTMGVIWIYDTTTDEKHQVTSGFFNDNNPVFSRKGDFLYYVSNRDFTNPQYEDVGTTFAYARTQRLIAVPLNKDVENPSLIESDEETWKDDEKKDDDKNGDAKDEAGEGDDAKDEAAKGDDDAKDEDAADASPDADTPKSPIHGVWTGKASGLSKIPGMTEDEADYKLTVIARDDGSFTGSSSMMGQTNDFDSITFDESSGEFTATRSKDGVTSKLTGRLEGDTLKGAWEVPEMGISGTFELTRSDEEPEASDSDSESDDKPVEIDLADFERRGVELDVESGNFANLASNDQGALLYVRFGPGEQPPAIKIYDIKDDKPEEKNVLAGAGGFEVSADGKKIVAGAMGKFAIVNASSGQTMDKPLHTDTLTKTLHPREEWEQIFTDAWRRHRDFFYVENMHGVDWDAVYTQYHAMLDDAASREDVSYIISEMISELNVGHAYYWGGDIEDQPSTSVGMLGADFELATETDDQGVTHAAYRFTKLYEGAAWDTDARNPLRAHGIDAKPGTYLLAVNGAPVDTAKDPWAAFLGLAGQQTTLTLADALVGDDKARNERDVTMTPLDSETNLRYRAWIETNRKYVEERSSGRVGYIYVPNTGVDGQNDLFRQFYGQAAKDALIIDERWNGGGQIPTRFIELLNRPRTNYWARRDGKDWPWPPDSHQGPKCMLINGLAGSGGDMFPWLFRFNNLGKLIGTRTWGGLVGISGVPGLVDGGYTAVPTFGFYERDGTWGIEGHGVDPDIEVIDDPGRTARGQDPQLDAAIDLMISEADRAGYNPAQRPADPDRKGMGIREEDK